jgi:hypothetical protein
VQNNAGASQFCTQARIAHTLSLSEGGFQPLNVEFPISKSSFRENHTYAPLVCQVQIDMIALGSHRGSFGSFADLFGLFLASNLPVCSHLSPLDHF